MRDVEEGSCWIVDMFIDWRCILNTPLAVCSSMYISDHIIPFLFISRTTTFRLRGKLSCFFYSFCIARDFEVVGGARYLDSMGWLDMVGLEGEEEMVLGGRGEGERFWIGDWIGTRMNDIHVRLDSSSSFDFLLKISRAAGVGRRVI